MPIVLGVICACIAEATLFYFIRNVVISSSIIQMIISGVVFWITYAGTLWLCKDVFIIEMWFKMLEFGKKIIHSK